MRSMLVKDVMTSVVVTAGESTPYLDIVRLLADHHISAVPVVAADRTVVGVVSEADLLLKEERPHALAEAPLLERRSRRRERTKAAGVMAKELMTTEPVTARPDETVREAARRMHARRVRRLPVVDAEGRLVGIVSRSDLLRVFLRPDEDIALELQGDLLVRELMRDVRGLRVAVDDGVVTLTGHVEQRSHIPSLVGAAEGVDGVVRVDDRLEYDYDDTPVMTYPYL